MSNALKVLVIEDEPKIIEILQTYMEREGYQVSVLSDGADAVEVIKQTEPEFIILDLMLPNKDGFTICKEVRQFSTVPIIMLTARVDEIDRLMGLEFGADDYVCKPFSPREVVARMRTIMRRMEASLHKEEELAYQGVTLNVDRFQCQVGGQLVELTPVEFRLLQTLLARPGVVHSRELLMKVCYVDERVVSTRTIDSHVKNLRSKLSNAMHGKDLLHSIYGVGYKLE
ncbi:response regulator [Reinekea thalattae]|uniref:Response regulator n=1 Tax=Reinekea thalattae TaxID=2593301 RepID=A0A5C8Z408_9GAMM|nr:response regulator [Reinekea thalattae]TXR51928.1 response regulator [Reinekea thalattae]